ncbi:MAG: DUF2069 domain-containing protein [Rhodoferax sp.]|nr:DUF2069 domain-containing protein [Rhodoferax sp.]MDZ7891788.1 DUF2069 domain-containing protein [Rhodoferax sp.]
MRPVTAATPAPYVVAARWAAVASLIGLIVLGLVWELWLAPTGRGTLALKVLPLCIPLAGLLKSRMYTYRWLSLMVWLYFTEGVVRAWSDKAPGNWLALIEVALCIVLFVACTFHIRLRLKAGKALQPASDNTTQPSSPSV